MADPNRPASRRTFPRSRCARACRGARTRAERGPRCRRCAASCSDRLPGANRHTCFATAPQTPATASPTTPAPAEAAKPTEGTPAAPKTSLMAEAGKPPESPAPASSDAAPVATEAPPPAPLPSYDMLALPEGVTLDKGRVGEFDGMMGRFEQTHGVSHEAAAQFRQELVNMYVADQQRSLQLQHENWNRTREGWRGEIKDNPAYGKTRFDQTMKDVAAVRDRFSSPQFLQMIEFTGAGDHPGMIEFVNNVAKFLDKHGLLREGRPLATTIKPVQQPQSRSKRRYANGPNLQERLNGLPYLARLVPPRGA